MLITVVPTRIDFFRPKRSPTEKAAIAPKKQLLKQLYQFQVLARADTVCKGSEMCTQRHKGQSQFRLERYVKVLPGLMS